MNAVYIVNNSKVAKTLIDPMRRAILDLLRQKPMTQAQMADELGLSSASLNYHIKILRSRKLVVVAKREYERHGIKQIFFSYLFAYLFVYDLDSLPKSIARYFSPISLERARSAISLLIINNRNSIDQAPNTSNSFAETLSRQLVKVAKAYVEKQVNHAQESVIYEIYTKAMSELLGMKKNALLSKQIALNINNK